MMRSNIFCPVFERMKCSECAAWFPCIDYKDKSVLFWKETLQHICEDILGQSRIHEKGIKRELMTKLKSDDGGDC